MERCQIVTVHKEITRGDTQLKSLLSPETIHGDNKLVRGLEIGATPKYLGTSTVAAGGLRQSTAVMLHQALKSQIILFLLTPTEHFTLEVYSFK
jgi:hypothetical protein